MGDPSYDAQTALVVVDVQNDFAHPDGGLYVRGGENLVSTINAQIAKAREAGVELRAPRVHDAVVRPDPAVLGEVRGRRGMPVGRVHDDGAGLTRLRDLGVDRGDEVLATPHVQPAIGMREVVLDVDHHERGLCVVRRIAHRSGDGNPPPWRPFSLPAHRSSGRARR